MLKERVLSHRGLPRLALPRRVGGIECPSVVDGVPCGIARRGGKGVRLVLITLAVVVDEDGGDGPPSHELDAGLLNDLRVDSELEGELLHGDGSMAVDGDKHVGGARDIKVVHAANGGVSAKQDGSDADLGTRSPQRGMEVVPAGHAEKEFGHTDAAGARSEEVTALMDENEDGDGDQAPEDR